MTIRQARMPVAGRISGLSRRIERQVELVLEPGFALETTAPVTGLGRRSSAAGGVFCLIGLTLMTVMVEFLCQTKDCSVRIIGCR